jgi:hypothetical protein
VARCRFKYARLWLQSCRVPPAGFRASTVDLIVPNPKSSTWRAALELKWFSGKEMVAECGWDAYKLGSLYRDNRTDAAYLVGVGRHAMWQEPLGQLFAEERVWMTDEFERDYPAAFQELIEKGPAVLPAGIRSSLVAEVPIVIAGEDPWWGRSSRIATVSGRGYAVRTALAGAKSGA